MNYLRNPLNASRRIKRSDANIAQTVTRRGGVYGDHLKAESCMMSAEFFTYPSVTVVAGGRVGVFRKFGPDVRPIFAKILPLHGSIRLLLNEDTQLAAEFLLRTARLAHVSLGRLAPSCKISAVVLGEAVEVIDELIHSHQITIR